MKKVWRDAVIGAWILVVFILVLYIGVGFESPDDDSLVMAIVVVVIGAVVYMTRTARKEAPAP